MKTPLFLSILLLAVLSVSNPPFSSAAEGGLLDPVLDRFGNLIRIGVRVYMVPIYPISGGLQLQSLDKPPCSTDIVLLDQVPGQLPVTFSPINNKKNVIRVSTDLNVVFLTYCTKATNVCSGECPASGWWKLGENNLLAIGGTRGNPGPATIKSWFKIEKFGPGAVASDYTYKLVYCPTFCSSCNVTCKDVGIVQQNGKRRLGLSDVPLKFMFQRD